MTRWLRRGWYLLVVLFLAWSLVMLIQGRIIGQRIAGLDAHIAELDAQIAALPPITSEQRVRFDDLASRPWLSLTPAEKAGTNQYLARESLEHSHRVYSHEVGKAWREERGPSLEWMCLEILVIVFASVFLLGHMLWHRLAALRRPIPPAAA
jgi:hypothetical protein